MKVTITFESDAFRNFDLEITRGFRSRVKAENKLTEEQESAEIALDVPAELIAAGAVTIQCGEPTPPRPPEILRMAEAA